MYPSALGELCSFICWENLYIGSDRKKITLNADSTKEFKTNFVMIPVEVEIHFQTIYFKKNEISMVRSDEFLSPDTAFCHIKGILKCRKAMVIEVSGNCSPDEEDKDTLSLKRARIVKEKLISIGINSQRIYAKGYSDKNYYDYKRSREENAKFNNYYNSPHLIQYEGQAVYIRQLSNDFGVPTESKDKSKVKTKNLEEDSEE